MLQLSFIDTNRPEDKRIDFGVGKDDWLTFSFYVFCSPRFEYRQVYNSRQVSILLTNVGVNTIEKQRSRAIKKGESNRNANKRRIA